MIRIDSVIKQKNTIPLTTPALPPHAMLCARAARLAVPVFFLESGEMKRGCMRGKKPVLTFAEQQACSMLTYRAAKDRYGIGFKRWHQLKAQQGKLPFVERESPPGGPAEREVAVLASAREELHLNTAQRAAKLGMSATRVQDLLAERGLSKLTARLKFAGYQVERCQPLRAARQRRIVAAYPGSLAHIDFRTVGFLRGRLDRPLDGRQPRRREPAPAQASRWV